MSQVIRDAVIRLKWEQSKAKLEAPDYAPAKRAAEEVKKATVEASAAAKESSRSANTWAAGLRTVSAEYKQAQAGQQAWAAGLAKIKGEQAGAAGATVEATRATVEHTRVTQEFGFKSVIHFREAGEGALRMTRGLALLSASGSESLQKLVRQVAIAQGALDIFAGGFKLVTFASKFGQVGLAIAGVTAALSAGVLAWQNYLNKADEAAEKFREATKDFKEFRAALLEGTQGRQSARGRGLSGLSASADRATDLLIDATVGARSRQSAIAAAVAAERKQRDQLRAEAAEISDARTLRPGETLREHGVQSRQIGARYGGAIGARQREAAIAGDLLQSTEHEVELRRKLLLSLEQEEKARLAKQQREEADRGIKPELRDEEASERRITGFREQFEKTLGGLVEYMQKIDAARIRMETNLEVGNASR